MTAISQRVPNFLGGVSQQSDERLYLGQVKEATNVYPDPTLGLTKRPGGRYISQLKKADGTSVTPGTFDNSAIFTIFRDQVEEYLCAITNGNVEIWSLLDGTRQTVTVEPTSQAYLSATDYRSLSKLSVNDFTLVTNSEKTVAALPAPSWTGRKNATITILESQFATEYIVIINGTTYKYKTRTDYVTGDPPPEVAPITLQEILDGLKAAIPSSYSPTIYGNTIELSSSSSFDIEVKGGASGRILEVYQDSVTNISDAAEKTVHGRLLKITSTTAEQDDIWIRFVAENGTSGKGYWEETVAPNVSPGLDPTTMPQGILRKADGTFEVFPLDGTRTANNVTLKWEPRLVGDDETNSHPSFVGSSITQIFFHADRFGVLTDDNVSMSQTGEYFNFYHVTASTQVASDPVDLSCSSIKPAVLHAVISTAQGLLLFSANQQFMMEAENGIWTPVTVTIRTLSNYEVDPFIDPVDMGTTVMFLSKNSSWTRVFEMMTRGQRENPLVQEQSRVVTEWIPSTVDQILGSPQNGLFSCTGRSMSELYIFRFYEQGGERQMSAWFKWAVHGQVLAQAINNDTLYLVVETENGYEVCNYSLVQTPTTGNLINNRGSKVDPYLDSWVELTSITYDSVSRTSKCYLPTHLVTTKEMMYVVGPLKVGATETFSGLVNIPTIQSDGGGSYFIAPGDLTQNFVYIGYPYTFEVLLPRYLYGDDKVGRDISGSTVISRMKFYTGLGGSIYFQQTARGRSEWTDVNGVREADTYEADDTPFVDSKIYQVPVYQRPQNYQMRIVSNLPFPVSLITMTWEGQYSTKFYRRT